jgi:hypothetical protein
LRSYIILLKIDFLCKWEKIMIVDKTRLYNWVSRVFANASKQSKDKNKYECQHFGLKNI